jgi:hypothetical protein
VRADLDALVTALYVWLDDLLPRRAGPGRPAKLTGPELIALAVARVFLGCSKEGGPLGISRVPRTGRCALSG